MLLITVFLMFSNILEIYEVTICLKIYGTPYHPIQCKYWAHDNQDHFFGNDMKIANEEVFAKILGSAL